MIWYKTDDFCQFVFVKCHTSNCWISQRNASVTLDRFLWESQLCCGIFCFLLWHLKAMSRCYCEQCQKVDRIVVYFFWLHGVLSFRCDKCLCSLTAVHQTLQTVCSANRKTVLCLSCRGRPWALPRCNLQQWWEYVWVMLTVLVGRINEVYRKIFECFVFDKFSFILWKTKL